MAEVFVYGTLRGGASNHFRMAGADFIGAGEITGRMYRIDWYPALVLGGDSCVRGEVYSVNEVLLEELDVYEGITSGEGSVDEYVRVKTEVRMNSGAVKECWVWEWVAEVGGAKVLESEDWLKYEPNPS